MKPVELAAVVDRTVAALGARGELGVWDEWGVAAARV